jgi:hypothetical protein
MEIKISGWDVLEVQREAKKQVGWESVAVGNEMRGGRQWHSITLQPINPKKAGEGA